jgi:hypothetical protein
VASWLRRFVAVPRGKRPEAWGGRGRNARLVEEAGIGKYLSTDEHRGHREKTGCRLQED